MNTSIMAGSINGPADIWAAHELEAAKAVADAVNAGWAESVRRAGLDEDAGE